MDRDHTAHLRSTATNPDQRTVVGVSRAEDGWSIEVEDTRGVRLTYWIAGVTECIPHVGDTARFYGGVSGAPLHGLEINGFRVSYDDEAAD
jgi:hypothetical protein